jgi:hypothetical protein
MGYRYLLFLVAFALTFAMYTLPSSAGENCTCRGNGQDIAEGQTVCLKTASGSKLARCERVLNNTSWKILGTDCPLAKAPEPDLTIAISG